MDSLWGLQFPSSARAKIQTQMLPAKPNSTLRFLIRRLLFRDAVFFYRHLLRHGRPPFFPDAFTFPLLLKSSAAIAAAAVSSTRPEGSQLHAHVVKLGFCFDAFSCTGLVDFYAKAGDLFSSRKAFDEMPHRSLPMWTSMMVGYARAGDLRSAMEVFCSMPEKDAAVYNAMIDGFVKIGDVRSARLLFDEMVDKNVVSWTSLIYGYCRVGDMEAARILFDEMPRKNLYSWNVMIGGYCQNRQSQKALELFRELQSDLCPLEPDNVTIVSVIPAIADMGAMDLGRWIHGYAQRTRLDRRANVVTALVDMYAKCGDVCESWRVFNQLLSKEITSWNAVINGFAVNGHAKEALDIFKDMQRSGISPNGVTMIGVLSACSHGGLVEEGRRWFREMEVLGITRRVEHYGCMVDLLGRGGYLDEAEKLINDMPFGANGIVLSSLLFACGCHGDVERAERLMRMVDEVEPGNVRNYVIMRNLYAAKKMWGEVERIKQEMEKHGGKKEAGCSVVDVGSRVCEFVSGDKAHPEWEVICDLLSCLQLQMGAPKDEKLEFSGLVL